MKVIIFSLTFILAAFLCFGNERLPWTLRDKWYHTPSETGLTPWDWSKIVYQEVAKEKQVFAQTLLDKIDIIEITEQQAADFIGRALEKPKELVFYLVRGVYLNEGTGSFSVYLRDKQLWVYHGSLGKYPVPMKRKALLVVLLIKPEEIFVTCGMDE